MDHPQLSARFPQVLGLDCVLCGRRYSMDELRYTCPHCGPVGTLDVVLDPAWEAGSLPAENVWQARRFLPLAADMPPISETIPLQIGATPHYAMPAPGSALYQRRPFALKDDGRNPTASFKDRASAMVVHHALTIGAPIVATASTGNAAAALAGVCAATAGVRAVIFVPASAPAAKIAQLMVYGAQVILVEGSYDAAFDLCWEACAEFDWYNRSTGINPFTSEGKKTVAWELAFSGQPLPEVIFVAVGDGSIISGVYKGFSDLQGLGWIDRIPRLIGVQSAGSAALVHAWENGLDAREMQPQPADTLADSISAALPRDRAKALRAVRATEGAFLRVTDDAILQAIPALARRTGVFAEPAAAAVYAGWEAAQQEGIISPGDSTLLLITGSGLKDVQGAMKAVAQQQPLRVAPRLSAVREAVKRMVL